MTLFIDWQTLAHGPKTTIAVPVFDAGLHLVLRNDVITDASWCVSPPAAMNCPIHGIADQVAHYFAAPDRVDLHLKLLRQGSDYARSVWQQLLLIPAGTTLTYAELATKLGSGPRAVARACRDNPYAGLIPCHRVVAKTGVGGFMGQRSGPFVALKQRILVFESTQHSIAS
ncbi:MAG: methylated-DNA--[protein]-cysteine S-methyltransferase [Methylomonas sp.]|nr:methylated-DNA--[protein]-cysteine S-methyltransferase [Methylomonas sp.]PPD20155.1 MAG: cysteine methyltransferase [Methylomonas sp.]PPD26559.1 MAG: cysteine methyltransferase [Methylomonas sp.]PPD38354.1 MAG: cysteine methyltransferase [Methylomonas sp.]PPD52371.1 MAG: cysteine methyltransferase [Methylomonas sp.]